MQPNWRSATVAELQTEGCLLVEDGNHGEYRPRPEEFEQDGTCFIRAADMDGGRVLFRSASRINDLALSRIRKGIGAPGDVLLSHKGTVGKVAFAPLNCEPFVCSPQTTFWRVLNERVLDRRYLYHYLQSLAFQQQLASRKAESDMADYVSLTVQRTLRVAFPPVEEQQRIGNALGVLDDKIDLNRRMNQTLEAMAQAVFKSWFLDFDPVRAKAEGRKPSCVRESDLPLFPASLVQSPLGEIPKGWRAGSLGEVIRILDSRRVPLSSREREQRHGPYPYYGAASVMDHVDDYLFDGVFVLLAEDGSVVDEADRPVLQYVWGKFWVNNHAHVLQGKGGPNTEHLLLALKQVNVRPYITGAVQLKLSQGNMCRIPLVIPEPRICEAFGAVIKPLFARVRANTEESLTLAAIRDALLPKLLSGELRIQHAKKLAGVA